MGSSSPRRGENTKKIETTKQISYEWFTCLCILYILTCANLCCFMLYALPSLGLVRQNSLEQGSCCQNSRPSKAGATTRNHRTNTHPETYITQCHLQNHQFSGAIMFVSGEGKGFVDEFPVFAPQRRWLDSPPWPCLHTRRSLMLHGQPHISWLRRKKNGSSTGNPSFQGKKPRLLLRCMARAPKKNKTLQNVHPSWAFFMKHNMPA